MKTSTSIFDNRLSLAKRMRGEVDRSWSANAQDLFISPVVAGAITIILLIVCAWGTRWLEFFTRDSRPFTLFFLIPVAFSAAFFGIEGGIAAALVSLLITRFYLFPSLSDSLSTVSVGDFVEMAALFFGTFTIAVITGRLRSVLGQLRQANIDLRQSEQLRRGFNKEVLSAVTGGVLELCDAEDLGRAYGGSPDLTTELETPEDASRWRRTVVETVKERGLADMRLDDLSTAIMEAASNAVKHGCGGRSSAWIYPDRVTVLIEDHGGGISPAQLARATLERGYSTRVSLGMGYYMMIESVDRMLLCTTPQGTSILLTVCGTAKSTIEQNILTQYSSL